MTTVTLTIDMVKQTDKNIEINVNGRGVSAESELAAALFLMERLKEAQRAAEAKAALLEEQQRRREEMALLICTMQAPGPALPAPAQKFDLSVDGVKAAIAAGATSLASPHDRIAINLQRGSRSIEVLVLLSDADYVRGGERRLKGRYTVGLVEMGQAVPLQDYKIRTAVQDVNAKIERLLKSLRYRTKKGAV